MKLSITILIALVCVGCARRVNLPGGGTPPTGNFDSTLPDEWDCSEELDYFCQAPFPPEVGVQPPPDVYTPAPPLPDPGPAPAPQPQNNAGGGPEYIERVPIYRAFNSQNGDHHLTNSWEEIQTIPKIGYYYEGVAFVLAKYPTRECPLALQRCLMRGHKLNHFTSTDPNCEGHINEGVLGYTCGEHSGVAVVPLFRSYNPTVIDHITSGWVLELVNLPKYGYTEIGLQAWAPM